MKRCPTCNRTFSDPNLSFCIEDGTPLVNTGEPAYDAEATVVSSSASPRDEVAKEPDNTVQWPSPAYQPPPIFPPPPPQQSRKIWPWVLGSLALLFVVFIGLGIAAAVLIPSMMKETANRNANSSSYPTNVGTNENSNSNANAAVNANAANANLDTNLNANENSNSSDLSLNENDNDNESDAGPPTDEEVVLADLKNIEDEWTVANLNADKKKLAYILADDYVSNSGGKMQGKADYLRDIQPDPTIQHWEFQNLKLKLSGSRAALTGVVSLESSQRSEPLLLAFTDKFVWREGRWQAVSSDVSPATKGN